jgi:U4/U6.U5 tri-snRNP-associated protein 2
MKRKAEGEAEIDGETMLPPPPPPPATTTSTTSDHPTPSETALGAAELEPVVGQPLTASRKKTVLSASECIYMDTIDRSKLDFDQVKVCSVSLSDQHVYACLVCGKFFQGRSKESYAFQHSFLENHHMFINLSDDRIYALPENYEVVDQSVVDIKRALHPEFPAQVRGKLDDKDFPAACTVTALDGVSYVPGVLGLSTPKEANYINAAVQALAAVPDLRNFFLDEANYAWCESNLVRSFGGLVRKLWHSRAFKALVSPNEFLLACADASANRFTAHKTADTLEFLSWFLNQVPGHHPILILDLLLLFHAEEHRRHFHHSNSKHI